MFTAKRPYRCHTCGWREWTQFDVHAPTRPDIDAQTLRDRQPDRPLTAADLDQLDLPEPSGGKRQHHPGPLGADEIDAVDPDRASD